MYACSISGCDHVFFTTEAGEVEKDEDEDSNEEESELIAEVRGHWSCVFKYCVAIEIQKARPIMATVIQEATLVCSP